MGDITHDGHLHALNRRSVLQNRIEIEQGLGGVFVKSVARVDDRAGQGLGEAKGSPLCLERTTKTFGPMACRVRAVSSRVSPFETEEPPLEILITSADKVLPAISKEVLVRVESSKKRLMTVFPRRGGTFLMSRESTSLKDLALSKISSTSETSKSFVERICFRLKGAIIL